MPFLQPRIAARATDAMPANATLETAPIDAIPLYNGDDEDEHGVPPSVAALRACAGVCGYHASRTAEASIRLKSEGFLPK